MPDPGRACYELWTSPNHAPLPDHLPTLIATPAGRPQHVLYTFLHTNYNQENYLLTPSAGGDLCVAKLFPSSSITGAQSMGGSSSAHGSLPPGRDGKVVRCEASRALKWTITNTGIAMPTYKITLPSDPDISDEDQPLFQISKTNKMAPFWTLWYYTYAGHLIPPRRVEFGRIEKTAPPGTKGAGGTRVIVTGKTDEEKLVWKTLGDGNEDMVEWIVLCAALNVLDDEIRDAAKTAGQPLRPPPKPGSAPALPRMVIPPMRRTSRDNGPPPLQQSLRPNTRSSPVGQPTPNGSASISSRSPDSSGSGSRRPQVPPQAAQQQAFSRQQQQQQQMYVPASGSNPGGQGQFQPPPRSLDQSMQGLNINTQVAQAQSRASPGPPGNMSAGSRRPQNPPQLQQHQLPPRNLPPGQQQQSASYRTVSAGRPQQRMSPPNGSYSASPPVSSSANGYISQPDARRQVSPPINESRGGRPMAASPPPPQSNGLSLPSQFTSAESSRPVSPRLPPPAGSPTGPRSLGPPRPGAMQAQSGSLPTGPRKMPSIGALNTRGRSPDPSSMPNGPRPMSPPIKSPSSASPTGLGGRGDGIPDSLKPRRAPPVFDDSELAYAN